MARISKFTENKEEVGYMFYCPGCEFRHAIWTKHPNEVGAQWQFVNNDMDKPTFSPSLLNRGPFPEGKRVCHLFIKNGQIQFLKDCTHKLAGQTVDMEEVKP